MKDKSKTEIPYPNRERFFKELKYWENSKKLSNYPDQEIVLEHIFKEYKGNDNLNNILIKVCILNDFYSTHIFSTYDIAAHILQVNDIDNRLNNGDPSIVEDIANFNDRCYYSFASKYCSFHNPDKFPIYDDYNSRMLRYFRNKARHDNIDFKFKNSELKNYKEYRDIIDKYRTVFHLEEFSYKEIDRYNWTFMKRRNGKAKN